MRETLNCANKEIQTAEERHSNNNALIAVNETDCEMVNDNADKD